MNEETKVTVEMTAEEKARFEAFRKSEEKRAAEAKARADREMYKQLVDDEIEKSIPVLLAVSEKIKQSTQGEYIQDHQGRPKEPHLHQLRRQQAHHAWRICNRRLSGHCRGRYRYRERIHREFGQR